MVKKVLILFSLLIVVCSSNAQAPSAFTIKYFGLTIHPFGDKTAELQPYKLDRNARFVANFGCFLGYERFVFKDLVSIKIIQAGFTDCSGGLAGFTHVGVRMRMFQLKEKSTFYFGFGPAFMYRDSWERFGDAYSSSGYFNSGSVRGHEIQYKLIPYACEIEWDYKLNEKNAFSVGFTPGIPMALTFSVGWKHWIHKPTFDYLKLYIPKNPSKRSDPVK